MNHGGNRKMHELMKKIVYAIAALALIFTGCAKELDNSTKDNFSTVRLHVKVADQLTKVSADNDGRYHWQAGDKITVFNDVEDSFEFSTENGGSDVDFGATSWAGSLGKYAMYPASGNHLVGGDEIYFHLPSSYSWSANTTNMPMLGKINEDVATFKAVGGVLKLVCYNVPADAVMMEFSATNKQISGDFEIANGAVETPIIVTAAKESSNNLVSFDFTGHREDNMVFYIPLPTGTIDGFTVSFLSDVPEVVFTKTSIKSLSVSRNQMIIAPALNCTAVADAVLTNAEILEVITGSYTSNNISSTSGTWSYAYGMKQASKLQLKKQADGGKLTLPSTFTSNISKIILEGTGNGGGTAFSGTVYFKDSDTNETIASKTVSDISLGDSITIDVPSGNTTGYITADGVIRIASVTVKFVSAGGTFPSLTATDDDLEIAVGSLSATTTVSLSNPVDALGISCVVNDEAKSWLSASISGTTLTVTAAEANSTAADRDGTVTLKATGAANVVISVTQPTKMVANPTVTATAGDSKFTATWAAVPHATSYVAYLHTAPTATPATGGTNITASISESAGTYSITDYPATNDTHYYLYVNVNEVDSNYEAVSEYAVVDFTPAEAKGTAENPYWAEELYDVVIAYDKNAGPDGTLYVKGYVSTANAPSSNTQTYKLSNDGSTTKQFQIYQGKGISGANITSSNRVYAGDYVVVSGTAKNYNGTTPQFNASSQIVTHYHLDIDYDEVEWAWNETSAEDFTVSINSTGDYKTFTHAESGMDWATVSVAGNVITITPKDNNESLVADREGTVTIHHASDLLGDIVISCKQTKAPAHSITIDSKTSLTVDLDGDHTNATVLDVVSAYSPWSVKTVTGDSAADGFTYSVNTSTNKLTITPKADNTTGSKREGIGTIVLTDSSNGDLCTITLNQKVKATSGSLTIDRNSFSGDDGTDYNDKVWSSTDSNDITISGSGRIQKTSSTTIGMRNDHPALRNTTALPSGLSSITISRSGTNRTVTIYASNDAIDEDNYAEAVNLGSKSVNSDSGVTWELTAAQKTAQYKYFYITGSSSRLIITSIVINYE